MRVTRRRAVQTLAAATTSPGWAAAARAQTTPTIRAAMIPIEPASAIYYAQENGFFSKAGINVTIAQNPNTPALMAAVSSGAYDIAYATISTLADAHAHNFPFVVIAPGVGVIPGKINGAIMVPVNSPITTAKDFNGKTFACAGLNTIAEYLPRVWIDRHGGDSSTVKFVEVPFPAEIEALGSGRADAAYLVEPFLTISLKRNVARMLTQGDDAFGKVYLATGWYTTAAWAKANPDLVARFTTAINEAGKWANDNPTKVVPILVNELHVDPTITAVANRAYFPGHLAASEMQPWIDVTAHYAKFPTFPAAELIYTPGRA